MNGLGLAALPSDRTHFYVTARKVVNHLTIDADGISAPARSKPRLLVARGIGGRRLRNRRNVLCCSD
jgi:hypothetical protein